MLLHVLHFTFLHVLCFYVFTFVYSPGLTVVSLRNELIEKSHKLHLVATGRQTIG